MITPRDSKDDEGVVGTWKGTWNSGFPALDLNEGGQVEIQVHPSTPSEKQHKTS
jgi:hypothetical protein